MIDQSPPKQKLVICVWHRFRKWRPKPLLAESIHERYPGMRVLHLPNYDTLPQEFAGHQYFCWLLAAR